MTTPWLALMQSAQLAADAQTVIALRLMRIARGGPSASREAQRMVVEKAAAAAAAQGLAAVALLSGKSAEVASAKALSHYRRVVRRNKARLSAGR